ncbi:Multidrug export protein MepA [compost metagenome]
MKPALIGEILSIGSPALLSQICNSIFLIAFNHRLGAFGGPEAISAFGIVSRLRSFLYMPISGIIQGLQPIIGFNCAAGLNKRVKEAIRLSILAAILYGLAIMLISILIPRELIRIFIHEEPIVSIGITALQSIAFSFPFMGALTITAAYFQSTGKALFAFALPMMSVVLISIPTLYILSWLFELQGLWFTYLVSDGITFLLAIFFTANPETSE